MSVPSVRFHRIAFGAIAALVVSSPAVAGGGPDCHEKAARMDVEGNRDGMITAVDHTAGADKRFAKMDVNKDGKITAAEIDASHGAESAAWAKHSMSSAEKIRTLDSNSDGALTRTEYATGSQKMFAKLDANSDGNLTTAEMQAD